jgi:hypothetical protein
MIVAVLYIFAVPEVGYGIGVFVVRKTKFSAILRSDSRY